MKQAECRKCGKPVHPPLCNECMDEVKKELIDSVGLSEALKTLKIIVSDKPEERSCT